MVLCSSLQKKRPLIRDFKGQGQRRCMTQMKEIKREKKKKKERRREEKQEGKGKGLLLLTDAKVVYARQRKTRRMLSL